MYELIHGDCLEVMAGLPDNSVDMILCDLPYGTTACAWDSVIPFDALWKQYKRIAKRNAAIVLTCAQPFTTALISSNMTDFRYDLKWIKNHGTGFLNANRMPLRAHEDIAVFYRTLPTYNPQKTPGKPYKTSGSSPSDAYGAHAPVTTENTTGGRHPLSWREFARDKEKMHPTQKPVALMEYLVRTYTNPGDVVLDNCMGSGTTGIACLNSGRVFVGIEKDEKYFQICKERMLTHSNAK